MRYTERKQYVLPLHKGIFAEVLMNDKQKLEQDLRALGIKEGDTLMMHCSYKSLGTKLTAAEIFEVFEQVLGEEGTLLLPALSYETVGPAQPKFDREKTPSCAGFLPEYFRTSVPGVVRSLHPTHSVCAKGRLAEELIKDHELDLTPVGEHSPITKLPEVGGKVLMLGCDPDHNTALHGMEEAADVPYVFDRSKRTVYTLCDGDRIETQEALTHDFVKADHWLAQRYSRVIGLMRHGTVTRGKLLQADCVLMDAKAMWESGVKKMKEDPYYFVERIDEIL